MLTTSGNGARRHVGRWGRLPGLHPHRWHRLPAARQRQLCLRLHHPWDLRGCPFDLQRNGHQSQGRADRWGRHGSPARGARSHVAMDTGLTALRTKFCGIVTAPVLVWEETNMLWARRKALQFFKNMLFQLISALFTSLRNLTERNSHVIPLITYFRHTVVYAVRLIVSDNLDPSFSADCQPSMNCLLP